MTTENRKTQRPGRIASVVRRIPPIMIGATLLLLIPIAVHAEPTIPPVFGKEPSPELSAPLGQIVADVALVVGVFAFLACVLAAFAARKSDNVPGKAIWIPGVIAFVCLVPERAFALIARLGDRFAPAPSAPAEQMITFGTMFFG